MLTRTCVITALMIMFFLPRAFSKDLCTLIVDASTGKHILQQGSNCNQRVTPASTFKIAISLMGFDTKILQTASRPIWTFKVGYPEWGGDNWKRNTDPASWMKYSVFWYSQKVVEKIGQARFERYVSSFDYGNRDVSGVSVKDAGHNGVWVMSSLQISPLEQISFMRKIVNRQLAVSSNAYDITAEITRFESQPNGWDVYGKTGTGSPGTDNKYDSDHAYGWYVGWATKGTQKIVFARLIQDEKTQKPNAGIRARDALIKQLVALDL